MYQVTEVIPLNIKQSLDSFFEVHLKKEYWNEILHMQQQARGIMYFGN